MFVPLRVAVFCFDFAGCGSSAGPYASLGHREAGYVACAVRFVRREFAIEKIVLWGKAMGASAALTCLPVPGLGVADSPLASIIGHLDSLWADRYLPRWLRRPFIRRVRRRILKKGGFDIADASAIDAIRGS
jgi:pimeloyl-ACP methyl ester carboxylesterase